MQIKMQRFEKVAKKVLNNVADIELYEWPPRCAAIFYQPILYQVRTLNHDHLDLLANHCIHLLLNLVILQYL